GAGPSGLACASDLAQLGYEVSVYDRESKAGGMVFYGVPKYRLPYEWIELEVNKLKDIGVTFHFNKAFGNNLDLDYLRQNYEAVYIAIGEEEMMTLNIDGDHLPQVYTSAQYLKLVTTDHMETISNFKKVVVIGGGNTSMDCARSALRLGAEVLVSYRRRQEDMPASKKEVEDAKKEGVKFMFLTSPIKIIGSSHVEAVEMVQREVIGDAGQHRQETQLIEGSNFIVDADCIIMALGSKPNRTLRTKHLNLDIDYKGLVVTNSNFETSEERVYAGGDMVLGADTVVRAIDTGKKAAKSIHQKLSNN
ncbi:MAG: FAD-dependent oxidoreductase, partial [Erysipelothrix sp.]|nr:FAD-dependent oxidoreductase [Erysipelothrix sp.]